MPQVKPVSLWWNKSAGDAWADFFGVDLDSPHFNGLEGVFVIWHGGQTPGVVSVSQGPIRDMLRELRGVPEIKALKRDGIFVTWAKVEPRLRDGVERFLVEALKPTFQRGGLTAEPVECNIPGRELPAGADEPKPDAGPPPGQAFEFLVSPGKNPNDLQTHDVVAVSVPVAEKVVVKAAPAAPKLKQISGLQKEFDKMLETLKAQPAQKGLFGGGAAPKPLESDALVMGTYASILESAVRNRASDIHVEPLGEGKLRVRFRIDGILEEVLEVPAALQLRLVSHIRVRCGLDPEQTGSTGKPQDGRMAVTVDGMETDLRLNTFPTPYGDKAVIRLIPRHVKPPELDDMEIGEDLKQRIRRLIRLPQGMIVVTGPAGSGKSTTLYTMLGEINEVTRNIVTLEDPIELKIPGIAQGALQPKVGFTFVEGLRSILRQDPNVIMVGEVRDAETAEISLSSALTGHMLITTLHTTSALGAVTRLLDMGLEPYLVGSALTAVFAQRLVRRVCQKCREGAKPTEHDLALIQEMAARAGVPAPPFESLSRGLGCGACRMTGFHGRLLLFELVEMTPALRQAILKKLPMDELRRTAVQEGAHLLTADGLRKAAQGLTTLDELTRVLGGGAD